MPGLSNTVDEPRPGIYCNNCNAIIRKPDAPAVPSSERVVVVEEGPYTVTATDDATPPPLIFYHAIASDCASMEVTQELYSYSTHCRSFACRGILPQLPDRCIRKTKKNNYDELDLRCDSRAARDPNTFRRQSITNVICATRQSVVFHYRTVSIDGH